MHLFTRNVNTAFHKLVSVFNHTGQPRKDGCYEENLVGISKRSSRNGDVLLIEEPVTITYSHPCERVLFNAARDANPFFHLYESLWMLAGRNDVKSLSYYNSRIKDYSDDGVTFNGAYGYRWRGTGAWVGPFQDIGWVEVDQLDVLVKHLEIDPNSRRAVLQMWNVEDDLLKIGQKCRTCGGVGLTGGSVIGQCRTCYGNRIASQSKDVCCNLSVMFSLRRACVQLPDYHDKTPGRYLDYLDMTVTNRSNDLVWGALGANVVHFSFLQEYMATRLDVQVGKYHHFTNNLHVYVDRFEANKWLAEDQPLGFHVSNSDDWASQYRTWKTVPLVKNWEAFERELQKFVTLNNGNSFVPSWTEPFFETVAQPMCTAFYHYKQKDYTRALEWCGLIEAEDWNLACTAWIKRRQK